MFNRRPTLASLYSDSMKQHQWWPYYKIQIHIIVKWQQATSIAKVVAQAAIDSRLFKIDTEDKGISFPVGERSTLKG